LNGGQGFFYKRRADMGLFAASVVKKNLPAQSEQEA
jgi:hypothetical protein